MKLVKSLLLGSVAGLAAVAGAQAADLPVKKAVAVDYVRVCSTYGAGYFFIPGSDTCLRLSGFAQFDALYIEQEAGREDFDTTGFRGRGRLNIDARQATEYGLLRAFIRFDGRRQSGVFNSGGEPSSTGGFLTGGTAVHNVLVPDQAYVQFGGLTAGRAQSFFDFYSSQDLFTTQLAASDVKTQTIAYTFQMGGGLSLTLAAEDNIERRSFSTPFGVPAGFGVGGQPVGFTTANPFIGAATTTGFVNAIGPGGFEYPDGVAQLNFTQSWGALQLSGAVHQIRATNFVTAPGATFGTEPEDEIGYALQAGVMFKLPFIAAGDELWLQATYADGAVNYAGAGGGANRNTPIRVNVSDAFVNQFGDIKTTEVFSVAGKFLHYWLPNLRSNFFAGYQEFEFGEGATRLVAPTSGVGPSVQVGFPDFRVYEAGANLIWTPVKQLDIGVEAVYRKIETKGLTTIGTAGTFGPQGGFTAASTFAGRVTDSEDVWETRLRIQREF